MSSLVIWGGRVFRSGRVIWAAEELGLSFVHRDISSRDGSTQTAEFLSLNPAGKIPGRCVCPPAASRALYLAACLSNVWKAGGGRSGGGRVRVRHA